MSGVRIGDERVLAGGLGFLEGIRWYQGEFWFSDFYARQVRSVDLQGTLTKRYYVAGQPSGLGPRDEDILIVSMYDGRVLRGGPDGSLKTVADIGATYRGLLNDMTVDAHGRAYVTTLPDLALIVPGFTPGTPLFLVDEHGKARVVADGLLSGNGMAITHDGTTLIVAETRASRLVKFSIAPDGSLGPLEIFADLGASRPDGICLDPSGAVWACSPLTSEFLLVEEGGRVLDVRETPGSWAVACAIDSDGSTLGVLTAEITLDDFHHGTGTGAVRAYRIEGR
jgi:sugar lactone lactonase YvrE